MATSTADCGPVLVSDFDGTMTRHDFYQLAIEQLLPRETPDFWVEYRAGTITHFEALRRYFAAIRGSESDVLRVVQQMELDPNLASSIEKMRGAGWRVVIASAGCDWYIRRLLSEEGINVVVHSNPGRFEAGKGLLMEQPTDSEFFSQSLGVDKTAIVKHYLDKGLQVAFAGDGFPDADPARLVPARLRLARGDLADVLTRERLEFRRFETWSEIPRMLLEDQN